MTLITLRTVSSKIATFTITLTALATQGVAQEATGAAQAISIAVPTDSVFIFNTLLFLICGFMVFWMTAGFAMLEAGLVRSRNVNMQLIKNVSLFCIGSFTFYLMGYHLMYPSENWLIAGWLGTPALTSLEAVGVNGAQVDAYEYAATASDFFFQVMFLATTASIVSGAVAERIKLWPFLAFVVVLSAFIYPIQASWSWGQGVLYEAGFKDFAGSTIVHSVGGWGALTGAIILGPRLGKYAKNGRITPVPGSNLTLATLGTIILWLGWFGFNGGSELALGSVSSAANVARIFVNTNAAAVGGTLSALILTQLIYKKPDLTMVLNGTLGGLVSITAEPLMPSIGAATAIGAIGGIIITFAVPLLDRIRVDDAVGAIPVHLMCGIWGTIAVVFTNSEAQLSSQLLGIALVGSFTLLSTAAVWLFLKWSVGIRVSQESEINGLDIHELGMEAYPEFSKI